ncbi:MAG TPA: hypothetical protein VGO91_10760 [Pyrinomonadaceae bacterium]|nr:hypothetical protein [Pyrinomonadaceae bacterium]
MDSKFSVVYVHAAEQRRFITGAISEGGWCIVCWSPRSNQIFRARQKKLAALTHGESPLESRILAATHYFQCWRSSMSRCS